MGRAKLFLASGGLAASFAVWVTLCEIDARPSDALYWLSGTSFQYRLGGGWGSCVRSGLCVALGSSWASSCGCASVGLGSASCCGFLERNDKNVARGCHCGCRTGGMRRESRALHCRHTYELSMARFGLELRAGRMLRGCRELELESFAKCPTTAPSNQMWAPRRAYDVTRDANPVFNWSSLESYSAQLQPKRVGLNCNKTTELTSSFLFPLTIIL